VSTFSVSIPGLPGRCHYCGCTAESFPLGVAGGQLVVQCPECFSRIGSVAAVPAASDPSVTQTGPA
jgi:hypothetical protein